MVLSRRQSALSTDSGAFHLLALDHGLTHGHAPDTVDFSLSDRLNKCAPFLTGVVLCPGPARNLNILPRTPLIVQCFGAPRGHSKVPVCSVHEALRLGATAVAVQLNLEDPQLSDHVGRIGKFTDEAHLFELPVLFMTSGYSSSSGAEVASAVRIAQELGADLVKVTCTTVGDDLAVLSLALRAAPPVLVAGGPRGGSLASVAKNAKESGFAGYCVGRHIYEAEDPSAVAAELSLNVFGEPPRAPLNSEGAKDK